MSVTKVAIKGVEYEVFGSKTVYRDPRDGRFKMACAKCGVPLSEVKIRNGTTWCNDCRFDERLKHIVDDHVTPIVKDIKLVGQDTIAAIMDNVNRKLHDMESEYTSLTKIMVEKFLKDILDLVKNKIG